MQKNLVYAIDFGTSNSLLAAASAGDRLAPAPLDPFSADPSIFRTLLYFPNMAKCYYGSEAIAQFNQNPGQGRLIRSIKKHLPIRSFIGTWIDDRPANLEDLIGFFLGEMRRRANDFFQTDVDRAVIGRPARFAPDDADDKFAEFRLEQGAKRAGFKEVIFCPEPVAAAYEYGASLTETRLVVVADFGGGTSDFTVFRFVKGGAGVEVLGMNGVSLAGDVFDGAVMRHQLVDHFGADIEYTIPFGSNVLRMPGHLMEKLCSPADISLLGKRDVREFLNNLQRWSLKASDKEKLERLFTLIEDQLGFPLFEAIERAKRGLSKDQESQVVFDYPKLAIDETVSRANFESFIGKNVEAILGTLDETLRGAGVRPEQIDLVCCTGGTAQVPLLKEGLAARFGGEKLKQYNHFHSVVQGLAHRAQQWMKA